MSTQPEPMNAATEAVWNLVCSYMHYDGDRYNVLTDGQKWEVYCLADGFGKMSSEQLKGINGGWDWSHIRDSSDSAIREMKTKIIELTSGTG